MNINQVSRQDVKLEVGQQAQVIEVTANVATLNYDNAVREDAITPQALAELPLLVAGGPRSSATFAILMPGVSTGGTSSAYDARINGGLESGDEAILDGVTMQEGFMSQNGMVSIFQDFPVTPDMVSEMKIMASTYEPQYGSTLSAAIVGVTKSGTSEYHGGGYEYHRNSILNARPWGSDKRPRDLENDYGFYLGGPAIPYPLKKVPGIYSDKHKSYFYVNYEAFRIAGGVNQPRLTVPTDKMRNGDFSEWVDGSGKLIPVYDPATVRDNPNFNSSLPESATNSRYLKDQFSCNGQLNVICPSDPRLQNSLANAWLKYVPHATSPGLTNNYLVPTPVPDSILAQTNYWLFKGDHYWGDSDHFAATIWYQGAPPKFASQLPIQIATESLSFPQFSFVNRFNWDHTFSPTLLNHVSYGYLNRNEGYGAVNSAYTNEFPKISGVPKNDIPPGIGIDGYSGYDCGGCAIGGPPNTTARPTNVVNDLLTWVKGKHTLKFGGELRIIDGSIRSDGNNAGSFNFGSSATGLPGFTSGNGYASFLLGAVTNANYTLRTIGSYYARQRGYIWHANDTWKVSSKLSLNLGLRWDYYTPFYEKYDQLAFFDPNGANPGAGGRPGVVKWAGDKWGAANSYGARYPETPWKKGFAPRVGFAYTLNEKTVVRAGYGIFFSQAFYPGWGGGMNPEGFNSTVTQSATAFGGYAPAFYWQDGFPAPSADQIPPFIDSTKDNGRGVANYRNLEGNRLPYAQQWNLTIERQLSKDTMLSVAYVANKGTRIPSNIAPINVLDPKLLSMGAKLNDVFEPGMTSLDGVNIPYAGWVEQMKDCNPTVAQAMLPYPQYCGSLQGVNEASGSSIYHSFQAKLERRFNNGLSMLGSYTYSKLLSSGAGATQKDGENWNGTGGVISPFERQRNKALSPDDVPQVFSLAIVYDLPFGKGKRFMTQGSVANAILGGWQVSTIFRKSSGIPFTFRSGQCNIPGQFRMGCIPSILKDPFLQDPGNWDVNKPLFDKTAFQPVDYFNYYQGGGPRVTNYRGQSYQNQDFALTKEINIAEKMKVQLYGQFFNMWNWHVLSSSGEWGSNVVNNDINSSEFGMWNGSVTNPRNIQLGLRISF